MQEVDITSSSKPSYTEYYMIGWLTEELTVLTDILIREETG